MKRIRDEFTHERRMPAELHGERTIARGLGPAEEGLDASSQLALGPALYNLVMKPAVERGGKIIAGTLPPPATSTHPRLE